MVYEALSFITDELNSYLKSKTGLSEDRAQLSNLVNQDGSVALKDQNKIVVSLVNVQEEKLASSSTAINNMKNLSSANPPICLNLYVLFSCLFSGELKEEALKFLSMLIGFFQSNSVFDNQSYPELDSNIDKISMQIQNLGFMEQNNLWGSLGAKYVPSILYKLRMIVIDEGMIKGDIPDIISKEPDLKRL